MCLRTFSILCTKICNHIKIISKKLLLIQICSRENSNCVKLSLCIINICFRFMLEGEDFITVKGMWYGSSSLWKRYIRR